MIQEALRDEASAAVQSDVCVSRVGQPLACGFERRRVAPEHDSGSLEGSGALARGKAWNPPRKSIYF